LTVESDARGSELSFAILRFGNDLVNAPNADDRREDQTWDDFMESLRRRPRFVRVEPERPGFEVCTAMLKAEPRGAGYVVARQPLC
jgi:hypothetical protein